MERKSQIRLRLALIAVHQSKSLSHQRVEDMTPEELNQLAEQQRMKMMGIKPKSSLEAVADGTAKAAAGAYGAGCRLMTLL